MSNYARIIFGIAFTSLLPAQTAEELVAKNLQAKGGVSEIKSIKTLRISGKMQAGNSTTTGP